MLFALVAEAERVAGGICVDGAAAALWWEPRGAELDCQELLLGPIVVAEIEVHLRWVVGIGPARRPVVRDLL